MEQDIKEKFDKVSVIKDEFEQRRKKYIRDRDDLKNYKVQISEEIRKVKYEHDLKEKKLTMHESYNLYNDAEKKMIQAENQVYNLKNFIIIKSREMNYEQLRDECRTLVDELNKLTIKKNLLHLFFIKN